VSGIHEFAAHWILHFVPSVGSSHRRYTERFLRVGAALLAGGGVPKFLDTPRMCADCRPRPPECQLEPLGLLWLRQRCDLPRRVGAGPGGESGRRLEFSSIAWGIGYRRR
jgi:hypothetical protein